MNRVAVLYATKEGQTRRIAVHLAAALSRNGIDVDLFDVTKGPAFIQWYRYGGVVVAASVHGGHHDREMVRFVREHRRELELIPATFLSVSLSEAGAEDSRNSPEQRAACAKDANAMIEAFLAETGWHPVHVKPAAGGLAYSQYNPIVRFVMKRIAKSAGADTDTSHDYEYTDWADLDRFAAGLALEVADSRDPMSSWPASGAVVNVLEARRGRSNGDAERRELHTSSLIR